MKTKTKKKLKSWLQLVRIPNLFTVPGDILVGHAAVVLMSDFSTIPFIGLCIISALIYCGGLILNDCFDYKEDLKERPKRPLPSGQISMQEAYGAWLIMTALALIIASFLGSATLNITIALVVLVILYNGPARKFPVVAFVVMGLCRGFNILLGASTAWDHESFSFNVAPVFITETLYILAVTYIAYNETNKLPKRIWCKMPFIVASVGGLLAGAVFGINLWGFILFALFLIVTFNIVESLKKSLPVGMIPPKIGQLIRNLLLLQASFTVLAAPEYIWLALILIISVPFAARVSKKFYSS
ncbi:MAG: UbiA family prenyltransferase [Lentisphaeraceae bacterium]|nr:UbiA family prenyltransferase [Lentisphaeraceae bacterium]